ncbi:MAG: hypothetical protein ACRD0V_15875 [Acidimicrobiales bacterium]
MTTNETGRTDPAPRPVAVDPDGEGAPDDDVFEGDQIEADESEPFAEDDTEVDAVVDGEPSEPEPASAESSAAEPPAEEPPVAEPLLANASGYRDRWNVIQTGFVDEPSQAVQSAGELLAEVMDDLTHTLATELEMFEARGGAGDEASTEDLRVAFQRYRSYFDRLLAA